MLPLDSYGENQGIFFYPEADSQRQMLNTLLLRESEQSQKINAKNFKNFTFEVDEKRQKQHTLIVVGMERVLGLFSLPFQAEKPYRLRIVCP